MSAVARRYALAAVDAAGDQGGADAVGSLAIDLGTFAAAYLQSAELQELVQNPALEAQRNEVLRRVGNDLGIGELSQTVIVLLADNERIGELAEVVAEVEVIADEQLSRQRAHVVSAIEMTKKQQDRLARALQTRVGKPIVLDVAVDPAILGGLVVRVGNFTIDSSIRRQLEIISERLHSETL